MRAEVRQAIEELIARRAALGRPVDVAELKVRERAHVEKFDLTGDAPRLVEYLVVENDGRIVEQMRPDEEG